MNLHIVTNIGTLPVFYFKTILSRTSLSFSLSFIADFCHYHFPFLLSVHLYFLYNLLYFIIFLYISFHVLLHQKSFLVLFQSSLINTVDESGNGDIHVQSTLPVHKDVESDLHLPPRSVSIQIWGDFYPYWAREKPQVSFTGILQAWMQTGCGSPCTKRAKITTFE